MKKFLNIIVMVAMTGFFATCDKMEDKHKKWIEDGEKIYAPRIDSLVVYNGIGRGYVKFWLLESPNVKTVDFFWDNDADSLIVPVSPTAGRDSFAVFLPLPEERTYTLYTRTTDNFGNHSLRTLSTVTSYGDIYKSTLANRRIRRVEQDGTTATISWLDANEGLVATEVRYITTTDASMRTIRTLAGDPETVCDDADKDFPYEYRSIYAPVNSIDTCYLEWTEIGDIEVILVPYELEKTGWTITANSEEPSLPASNAIDGITSNIWHNRYSSPAGVLPFVLTVDMQKVVYVHQIKLWRSNNDTKVVEFELSADNVAWTSLGQCLTLPNVSPANTYHERLIEGIDSGYGRYLRLTIPAGVGNNANCNIAEIIVISLK